MMMIKIGIFYKDKNWGTNVFHRLIEKFSSRDRKIVYYENLICNIAGLIEIRAVRADARCRCLRIDKAFVEPGIDEKIINEIILPCVRTPYTVGFRY